MNSFNIVNLNEFTWQLNVAITGGIFAVFSLIYDEVYIYYGLITFAFGVSAHVIYKFFEWMFCKSCSEDKNYWIAHLANILLVLVWILVLLSIYFPSIIIN